MFPRKGLWRSCVSRARANASNALANVARLRFGVRLQLLMLIEKGIHLADCNIEFLVADVQILATRKDLPEISTERPQIGFEIGWDLLVLD